MYQLSSNNSRDIAFHQRTSSELQFIFILSIYIHSPRCLRKLLVLFRINGAKMKLTFQDWDGAAKFYN